MATFSTIGIFSKQEGKAVRDTLSKLYQFLGAQQFKVLCSESAANLLNIPAIANEEIASRSDLAIVVGGDGTLLQTGRLLAAHHLPIVGINLGRLGFLVDVSPEDMTNQLTALLAGSYLEEQRCMLEAKAFRGNTLLGDGIAVNDVVLHSRNEIRMIEFTTSVDGKFVTTQRADGLIVATPTGSTAYSLSSGGPILHPSMDASVMVPICPHNLSSRPLVIHNQSRVEIHLCGNRPVDSRVSFDGHNNIELVSGDHITIQAYPEKMRLLHPQHYDYYQILRSKLHWGNQP